MKKVLLIFLFVFFPYFSFADISPSWVAQYDAEEFLQKIDYKEWTGKTLILDEDNKVYFYRLSDQWVSYTEYPVLCDRVIPCGFLLVNDDENDVHIPLASPTDKPLSDMLVGKNKQDYQFYYLSVLEIYARHKQTGEVISLNPEENITSRELDEKLAIIREWGKTEEFLQKRKMVIEDRKYLYPSYPYYNYVDGESTLDCPSKIPCYNQHKDTYNNKTAWSGCAPNAFAMIYGYYDRNGKTYILPGMMAPSVADNPNYPQSIKDMQYDLRNKMQGQYTFHPHATDSSKDYYSTTVQRSNFWKGINYVKGIFGNGSYPGSTAETLTSLSLNQVFSYVQGEVNTSSPIVLHLDRNSGSGGHAVVAYGYTIIGQNTGVYANLVRINMGWGPTRPVNMDYNLHNINNSYQATGVTKIKISLF